VFGGGGSPRGQMIDFQYDCQASKNIKNIFLLSAIISYHRNAKEAKTFPSD